jgi:hypothetical protein
LKSGAKVNCQSEWKWDKLIRSAQLIDANQRPTDNHEDASHRGDGSESTQGRGEDFIQRENPKGYAEYE